MCDVPSVVAGKRVLRQNNSLGFRAASLASTITTLMRLLGALLTQVDLLSFVLLLGPVELRPAPSGLALLVPPPEQSVPRHLMRLVETCWNLEPLDRMAVH